MPKKTKKTSKTVKKKVDASITFEWDKLKPIPNVVHTNVTAKNINDVFAMSAENMLASDPRYLPILLTQIQTIYDFMYSQTTPIN